MAKKTNPCKMDPAKPDSRGAYMILAERQRQVQAEHWTAEHDSGHTHGELALAAICYACPPSRKTWRARLRRTLWPWSPFWWKPKDRLADLVRSGALIAAEIDRILARGDHT
jgi:hypothetical protein